MNTTTTEIHHQLAAVTKDRDHWKANHDNRVRAAKLLTERTDMPMERIGAYKQYMASLEANQKMRELVESAESELLAVREDNHSMMLEIDGLRTERDALAAELAKLRAAPVVAAPAGFIPAPFPPDDDTRRNDAEFAAQQAAPSVPVIFDGLRDALSEIALRCTDSDTTDAIDALLQSAKQAAPSVPDEWREVMAELAADLQAACDAEHPHRDQYPSVMRKYQNDMRIVERARALLQSANHSEHVLEMVAPDCRNCANRGRVNGLSQESYCDSCIYQGRDWRENHFVGASKMVDTAKRRCEACAILPCSCK